MDRPNNAPSDRIRPLEALRAIRALIEDPDDTARVFDVIDALSGRNAEWLVKRLRHSPDGERLLRERPQLLARLSDRERLRALPPGSVGRVYADFMAREQISADGLVSASEERWEEEDPAFSEEQRWFGERLRDMHDLWHVVTGYQRDLVGEASLLAFTYAQTRNRGIGFIVVAAYFKVGREHAQARRLMRDAYRRGRRAAWLPGQDWEAILSRPLAEVRRELRVGDPPDYEQLRSEGAPVFAG